MQYKFNNCYFKQLYLNTIFNSEQVALENFYEAMIYLAFKFDAVVMARFGGERKIVKSLILKQVQRIVYHFCWKSDAILEKSRGAKLAFGFTRYYCTANCRKLQFIFNRYEASP